MKREPTISKRKSSVLFGGVEWFKNGPILHENGSLLSFLAFVILAAKHDGDRPVHAVPLRRLDDCDARHRQSTQIERIPQVLFRQVVDGNEILCLLYRYSQGELFFYARLILRASSRSSSGVASL